MDIQRTALLCSGIVGTCCFYVFMAALINLSVKENIIAAVIVVPLLIFFFHYLIKHA